MMMMLPRFNRQTKLPFRQQQRQQQQQPTSQQTRRSAKLTNKAGLSFSLRAVTLSRTYLSSLVSQLEAFEWKRRFFYPGYYFKKVWQPRVNRMNNADVSKWKNIGGITDVGINRLLQSNIWLSDQEVDAFAECLNRRIQADSLRQVGPSHERVLGLSRKQRMSIKVHMFTFISTLCDVAVDSKFHKVPVQLMNQHVNINNHRSLREQDNLNYDILLFPYNHNNSHWSLFVLDTTRKMVLSYDSLFDVEQNFNNTNANNISLTILYWYNSLSNIYSKCFNISEWYIGSAACPQQPNSCDCGVYCCYMMDVISQGLAPELAFNRLALKVGDTKGNQLLKENIFAVYRKFILCSILEHAENPAIVHPSFP